MPHAMMAVLGPDRRNCGMHRLRLWSLLWVWLCLCVDLMVPGVAAPLAASPAARTAGPAGGAPRLNVVKHRLRNGMTFLIVERRVAPTVAAYIRFKVGGVD